MKLPERYSLTTKGIQLSYELYRSDRQTLEISVHPDGNVAVTAPHDTSLLKIEEKIRKRAIWIDRRIQEFEQLPPPLAPRQWISGETHRYLGRQYRLKVEIGEIPSVKLKGAFFHVHVSDRTDTESICQMMEAWYRQRSRPFFEQRLSLCLRSSKPFLDLEKVDMVIRKMQTRWGSCTPSGRIVLNSDLIKAPTPCIDYIIMHELCHLQVMNHSPKFWQLLAKCMPDWEKRQQTLAKLEI
jgi:predicted metal-dependent hydrolase